MSTSSKRDVASRRTRLRTSSTSRTRNPTYARKDLKFVSLVLTQLQHWRCQIIAAACPCPTVCDRHVQPMSQQTPRKLRDSVSVAEVRMHTHTHRCTPDVCPHELHTRSRGIKNSDQRGWKLTACWVQAQRQRGCHMSPSRETEDMPKKTKKKKSSQRFVYLSNP